MTLLRPLPLLHRQPVGRAWRAGHLPRAIRDRAVSGAMYHRRWKLRHLVVISTLERAKAPRGDDVIPQYHVSVSARSGTTRARVPDAALRCARRAFGMQRAEEDNHEPGMARHLWLPVDPIRRVACECKHDEVEVVTDGHTWTNTRRGMTDPAWCRGCAFTRVLGRPCPLHP